MTSLATSSDLDPRPAPRRRRGRVQRTSCARIRRPAILDRLRLPRRRPSRSSDRDPRATSISPGATCASGWWRTPRRCGSSTRATRARPHASRSPSAETQELRTFAVYGLGPAAGQGRRHLARPWCATATARKYRFGRVAKRLDQLRQGQTIELGPEDDIDPRRCPISGVMLDYPGQLSPFALKPRWPRCPRVMQLDAPRIGRRPA